MEISVLMSVYKNDIPEHLGLALDSIYDKQTVKPKQVVIVLDGFICEELHRIIDEFCEKHKDIAEVVPLEKNVGLGAALEIGITHCKYEWIARMDADDISLENRFERQVNYIKNNREVDVVGGNIAEFNESINGALRIKEMPESHDEILKRAKSRNPINHMTVMMRKSAVLAAGSYQTMQMAEDYYLWLRMLSKGYKFGNIPEILVYARVGNGFEKRRGDKRIIKSWGLLQEYMLKISMITKVDALTNIVKMYGFVYCPSFVRKLAYNKLLRKFN